MPLFLELVRQCALQNPELARAALAGLRRYQSAPATDAPRVRPALMQVGGTSLRDCGGSGRTLVLVPSLINPPTILDLDPERSLVDVLARHHRVLLLDWGPATERRALTLDGHVSERLLPLLHEVGSVTLIGYCLGGTLALAAAAQAKGVEAVATLAAPYFFDRYSADARARLVAQWQGSRATAELLGYLPMEVLQSAFWQIDPTRIVAKFARFATAEAAEAQRFVALEDWANGGEPLPLPAAAQLVDTLFAKGETLSDLPACPMLHVTAAGDRIVPAATAATTGDDLASPSGHVGMIVGRDAPEHLHAPLLRWVEALGPHR